MPFDTLISLFGLAMVAAGTPGPNNTMLASSGATYGVRASLPHVFGISVGFPVMIFLVGLGLGEIFRQSASLQIIMRYAGALMLLWFAWKTANAGMPGASGKPMRPLRFIEAAAFQWINPKGWMATLAITSQFVTPEAPTKTAFIVAVVTFVTGMISTLAWLNFGRIIGKLLYTPLRLQAFNWMMAVLLVGFLVILFLPH